MEAEDKRNDITNSRPLGELLELRLRVAELEEAEARRQRVDKALRLSEKYFRTLIENTLDVITMLDKEGVITYQSPSIEKVLEYGEEELLGKNILQYIHPDDAATIVESMARIVDSPDDVKAFRFRFRHKDGTWYDLEGTGKAIIEGSELIGIIVNSRDISKRKQAEEELYKYRERLEDLVLERTAELEKINYLLQREVGERKQAEEALNRSEKYYRSLVEKSFDFINVLNSDGEYIYISPSVEAVTGYKPEEIIDQNPFDHMHPGDRERVMEVFSRIVQEPGSEEKVEYRIRHRDGSNRFLEAVGSNMLDDPAVQGVVVHIRDITERRQAEEALYQSERYFRSLVENAFDFVFVIDAEADFSYVSPSIEQVLGYSAEEVMEKNGFELIHPDDMEMLTDTLSELLLDEGGSRFVRCRVRHKDGSWRYCEAVGRNLIGDPAVASIVVNTRDVTELKQVELEKQQKEQYFQELFKNARDLIFVVGEDGLVMFANSAIETMLGYKVEEVVGTDPFTPVHPDDLKKVFESMVGEDQSHTMEIRVRHKDGSWRWHEATSTNLYDHPAVRGLVINARDITERKTTEEALRASEERYRSLVENINDVIYTMDAEGRIIYISPVVESLLGYKPDEIVGTCFEEYIYPDDMVEKSRFLKKALQGELRPTEFRLLDKDGNMRYVRSSSRPFMEGGTVTGITGILTDITSSKKSEKALRESERYFRSLIENAQDIITVLDSEGNVAYESPAIERILGYKYGEFLGTNVFELIHPDDVSRVSDIFFEAIKRPGDIEHLELRFAHADGSWRRLEVTGYNLLYDLSVGGVVINARDITDRKEAEISLRESEEKYRDLVENINEVILTLDNNGYITYCSPAIERLSGYVAEDLVGRHFSEFICPDDLQGILAKRALILRGEGAPFENRVVDKDGSTRYVRTRAHLRYKNGTMTGMIMVMTDISEEKKSQEELRIREAAMASSMSPIAIADLDGLLTYMNEACLRLWGYKELEEVRGKHILEFWESREAALDIGRALWDEGFWMGEMTGRRVDGSTFQVYLSANVVKDDVGVPIRLMASFLDITDRIKAEEALKESEEKFRLISEQSMMGIFIIQDDLIKYANKAGEAINEYSIEEALNWGPMEYTKTVHPDDRAYVAEQVRMKQSGLSGYIKNYTYRLLTKTGKVKWVEIYSKTVIYEGRTADLVTMIDVTDRIQMQEELKRSEEYFRSLTEGSSDVIVTITQKGMVSYVSPSIERVLGYKAEDILDNTGFEFINPDDIPRALEKFKQVLENPGKTFAIELRAKHRDGSWKSLDVHVKNLLDHPSVKAIVANYRDVSERMLMRERLFKINNLFLGLGADLIDNMDMIVGACCDILDGSLTTYCRMQKGRFSILSTAPGEDSLTVTEHPDDYLCSLVVSEGSGEPMIIPEIEDLPCAESDHLVKKYNLKSFVGYPVKDKKGKVIGGLGLFFEEKKELSYEEMEMMGVFARALSVEEERLAQEESLKDFIDIASHELRHPITLMKGYALTMRDFGEKMSDEAKTEYLNIINDGAERLNRLVKELLDVSRIERGRFSIEKRKINLGTLMERAVKEMKDKGCDNRFIISIGDEASVLDVDGEKMIGVMVILLDNAVKYSPEGSQVELTAERKDGEALISVLDQGKGIPERQRELIFERFFQVDDALHHSSSGMGLGLYIAREIVERHGGRIWCEPLEVGGTAFRFTIP